MLGRVETNINFIVFCLIQHGLNPRSGCPLSFETGGTIAVFSLTLYPLHIESPYNFGGKKPSAEGKWAC